ncbi:Fusaric acid resistance protein-like [Jatrophihabitans endophyticus]|uniref:Fusaric acid resistance protein-like n=1 Tax=Jatrophihabitans endophyticus TaxID=1206085 RepID=A0A1M5MWB3_9ACTN|nr:FUSC family protein [Jatrophihabitans endophyticus]SHG81412.1 Fusaric acid resistance protein-like [Jatrophihabitans endophyticus]
MRDGVDRLAGADPGLTQLRTATQAILGIVVAVGLVYGFVRLTGALQLPAAAGPPAVVTATNHALLIVSMLVGGILAMMAGFVVNDPSPRQQLVSTLLLPAPMLAAIAVGLLLGPYRVASLAWLVVLMTLAVYVRRWGPRGFAAGLVAFNGGFLGFFLHRQLSLGDLGWLAADVGLGVVAASFVRFVVLRDDPERALERMRRSWQQRARRLLDLGAETVAASGPRHRSRDGVDALHRHPHDGQLRRQVVRLNESTLIIEAQLVLTSPTSARVEAQELFGAELSLTNCARFCAALPHVLTPADAALRAGADAAVRAARDEQWPLVRDRAAGLREHPGSTERATTLVRRLALSLEQYAASRERLHHAIEERRRGVTVATFQPAVELASGFLPGSVPVSAQASTTPGRGRFERTVMPPYVRSSLQIAVAATVAVVVGDLVDGFRLYWAVLAAFLAFMATTNTGEQVRKALFRVAGTAIGIVVGDVLVHATGGNVAAALPVVLVVLFLGIYLIRTNYTFMVVGVTMMLSLLYYQLGEFSWDLLVLRLAETAVGVGAVVLTVLVVFPLRPQRVIAAGVLLWFRALATLLDHSLDRLLGGETRPLRSDIRALDASWAALEAAAEPLRRATFGRNSTQLAEIRAVSSAARFYARSLGDAVAELADPHLPALRPAARDLRGSVAAIDTRLESGTHGTYVRAAALVERAARELPADAELAHLALRDLTLLDGALARFAAALDMQVRDHDTSDLLGGGGGGGHGAPSP